MVRTIKGAVNELRKEDPASCVTEYALRTWIKTGALPAVKSGNKYLLDMEIVKRFLSGEVIC